MGPLWLPVEAGRGEWLKVGLPGPPNGASGWVRRAEVRQRVSRWLVVVTLSSRTETIYRAGKEVAAAPVATGAPDMPTPTGHTFIDGDVATVGPYAVAAPVLRTLALNSTSQLAAEEIGGTIIALHGWEDLSTDPGVFGYATSHGCIRAPAGPLTTALEQVPTGSPVWIES
jgi:lipoprotein-anchoring transpeptidase ErfK/SrfK